MQVAFALGVIALFILFGHRLFHFLGTLADKLRPTAENEARPGHDELGRGLVCLLGPLIMSVFFDPGEVFAGVLDRPQLLPILSIVVVFILMPLAGAMALLQWRNARLELSAGSISATNALGRHSPAEKILSAKMTPPIRHAGAVWFEHTSGWLRADTSWINIRRQYERLAAAGLPVDPWRDKATWKDIWSG